MALTRKVLETADSSEFRSLKLIMTFRYPCHRDGGRKRGSGVDWFVATKNRSTEVLMGFIILSRYDRNQTSRNKTIFNIALEQRTYTHIMEP